jgi:hypothetical protein
VLTRLGGGDDVLAAGSFERGRSVTIRREGAWKAQQVPADLYGGFGISETEAVIAGEKLDGGGVIYRAQYR